MRLPALAALLALPLTAAAQTPPTYDAALAKSLGADERGMRIGHPSLARLKTT
jgi:hypothetical protein